MPKAFLLDRQKLPISASQIVLLTHEALLLTVPQRGGTDTVSHQGKEGFLYLWSREQYPKEIQRAWLRGRTGLACGRV